MNPIAVVFKIKNGFLIVDPNDEEGDSYFVPTFDPAKLANTEVNHENTIRRIIMSFPAEGGKIHAIKAVRDYCFKTGFDKFAGLKEAKDHVENIRCDWHYPASREGDWR